MLDDLNVIASRDPKDALGVAAAQPTQASWVASLQNALESPGQIETVIVAGMGGSALAATLAKSWLRLNLPFEIIRKYDLPDYVNAKTLVVASSYSGNTEETLSCLEDAEARGAQIVIIASGGQLIDLAQEKKHPFIQLPGHYQPRQMKGQVGQNYYWRGLNGGAVDLVESHNGAWQAFDFRFEAQDIKLPKHFEESYPDAPLKVIHSKNIWDWL